ncbi:hypothetical protein MKW92_004275, partial [Papaver armeniacum]
MWEKDFVISQLQIIWVYCHRNFSTNYIPAGVISLQLIHSLSTTHDVVKIHVYTSMLQLTPSRGCFRFFRLYQILEYKDMASYQVIVLIKSVYWIYDRGKLFTSQGCFSLAASSKCCMLTITSGVTVFLVSTWTATYGYESVYRVDHVLSDAEVGYLHFV